ncbi:unnamed protein product [Effrenium voratum]|uniref:EF-hand domain-containing protein n=1 Tax=Effrenium voratum TaxID=2562239 RepID=A0AA36JQH7_9DINO|nr:unnamed protein product [Effrenium voratum]
MEPVLKVPGRDRLLLKDLEHVRIQSVDRLAWQRLSTVEQLALSQYLHESPDKKSWKVPNSSSRIGFNDQGVFLHQEHAKRFFGMLEHKATHLVSSVPTSEAIPRFFRPEKETPMLESLEKKVVTISDEMRKQVLRSTFRAADTNGNGTLSKHEVGSLMRRLIVTVTAADVEMLMQEADSNRDGSIDYEEFVTWMMITHRGLISSKLQEELGSASDVVRASFRAWDNNGNGLISKAEVQRILCDACKMSPKEVEILCTVMDADSDGHVDYDEFVAFLYPQDR